MKKKKAILPIAVIVLLLTLTLYPGTCAVNNEVNKKITILMHGVTDSDYVFQMNLSQEQLNEVNAKMDSYLSIINSVRDENSPAGKNISESEWGLIGDKIIEIIYLISTFIENFPFEEVKIFVNGLIDRFIDPFFLFKQPVISVGIGITLIPFYDYETFFGKMLRPIIIQHFVGFSATLRFNPFILGFPTVRFLLHRVRTFLFDGLFINVGDLGFNTIIGPQILLGLGCFTGFA